MLDLKTQISRLQRPQLLVKAARIGLKDYRRKVHLPRVLRGHVPAKVCSVLGQLCDIESEHNSQRKTRDAAYSVARHVEVLIALMAETHRFTSPES